MYTHNVAYPLKANRCRHVTRKFPHYPLPLVSDLPSFASLAPLSLPLSVYPTYISPSLPLSLSPSLPLSPSPSLPL